MAQTESLTDNELLKKIDRLITLTETNIQIQLENQKLFKTMDWKLWEILKITKSFSIDMNVEVRDTFHD